ncbi:MAG: GAF domain-containing protein [Bdellovibrionales bacterium]|nr:GAF domain-containing protein [Bdellovibrionales bacterium]
MEFNTDEQLRLRVLKEYNILDSESEQAYDDITYLASTICRTPISLVSFIDKDRQWFKSHRGTSLQQTSLDTSICACVAQDRQPMIVPDTMNDPRFRDMELMKGPPFIRFYAGVPLISPEGVGLGALCVIDLEPRLMTSEQMQALTALARQVVALMELRKSQSQFHDQQAKLIHKTKLASLGEMAASIAHEINNPLTIINGNVGLLRRILSHIPEGRLPKANQYLESIEKTVHRIDKIVRGLKALSRDGFNDPYETVDLTTSIINANSLNREKFIYHGIEVRQNLPPAGALIECRSVQIEQIIINLLSNSFDAVRDLPQKWVDIAVFDEGDLWVIRIADSGQGIPENLQDKIMQPFFTTKEMHQGTGLGLSISKAIAEEHGGSLELDPISKNTCFVLTLPKKQKGLRKDS